jgi:hypothetical protein
MPDQVTVVASGPGEPVCEHPTNRGTPMTNSPGRRPVRIVASGAPPVTFVDKNGVLQPGGV